jgi:hypothetical protein
VHVELAQYVVEAVVFDVEPGPHWKVEQSAFTVQQLYLPAVLPLLAAALNLQAPQLTVTPLHLVSSFSQQVLSSEVPHFDDAQYNVAAANFFFMPFGHAIVEHFAAVEQQIVGVEPSVPYFCVSLYLPVPQDTQDPPHLVASFMQHKVSFSVVQPVPVHVVVQGLDKQRVVL